MKEIQSQKIKAILKKLMKKKGLTYEDLALELDCSVPTVNRILGPEELTRTRMLEICEILDLQFSDLAALMKDEKQQAEQFTADQEHFLVKQPHIFAYFMKLISNESPKEIAEQNGLSQRSTDKYLIALENHGLIKVTGKNKIRPSFKSMPSLGKGPLGKVYFEKIITAGGRFFTDHIRKGIQKAESSTSVSLSVGSMKMTKTSYAKFVEEYERLYSHFGQISELEEKSKKPSELMTLVTMSGHTLVDSGDLGLKTIDQVFGEIKNI